MHQIDLGSILPLHLVCLGAQCEGLYMFWQEFLFLHQAFGILQRSSSVHDMPLELFFSVPREIYLLLVDHYLTDRVPEY